MSRRLVQLLWFGSLLLLALAWWKKDDLPQQALLHADLLREPEQAQVRRAAFDTTVNGVSYKIQPLYSYDLHGLVVSMHDAKTWWDYIHRGMNDHLNVMDLCVVWGNNVRESGYQRAKYSSGQFECFANFSSMQDYQAFDTAALSNNHLLTDKPDIAHAMRKVRLGDQVRFRGYLAEYSHNHDGRAFHRGTSTVRNDMGNGACETIYVEDFEILQRGGGPWRAILWVAAFLLAAATIGWFRLPLAAR